MQKNYFFHLKHSKKSWKLPKTSKTATNRFNQKCKSKTISCQNWTRATFAFTRKGLKINPMLSLFETWGLKLGNRKQWKVLIDTQQAYCYREISGVHFLEGPEIRMHYLEDREEKKSPAPGRLWTLDLSVTSRALYHSATTAAHQD